MGYNTDFYGQFNLDKPLTADHADYLSEFSETRRMKRDAPLTEKRPDPVRERVGLPVGVDGGYFVGAEGLKGQEWRAPDVTDGNNAPRGQPDLWCNWTPTKDLCGIEWNGSEKFYEYGPWLSYIIGHFLAPWGYVLNGEVAWEGEEQGDTGLIVVTNNDVRLIHQDDALEKLLTLIETGADNDLIRACAKDVRRTVDAN